MKTYTRKIGKLDLSSPNWGHVESVKYIYGVWCIVYETVAGGDQADKFSNAHDTANLDADPVDVRDVTVMASSPDNADRAVRAYLRGKTRYITVAGRKANVRVN